MQIDRFSALIGTGLTKVFDYKNDAEMVDSTRNIENPQISDTELYVSTDNAYSDLPPNFLVNLNAYGWNSGGFGLVKFTIVSHEASGFEGIAEVDGVYGFESNEYLSDINTMDIFVGDASTHWFQNFITSIKTLHLIEWFDGYSGDEILFWNNLNYDNIDNLYDSDSDGSVNFMAISPISMSLNDVVYVWVAVAVGGDREEMKVNMTETKSEYMNIISVEKDLFEVPSTYSLKQNFPNPFNPSTKISFSITEIEFVSLYVYNALGEKAEDLVNGELSAGNYTMNFDASKLTSGIYFYKMVTNNFTNVKKMRLIK